MLAGALALSAVPVVHVPFEWMETFFHEISHGIAAVVTGGGIERVELNLDGSGLCTFHGGSEIVATFAGYAGAIIWGALIYLLADDVSARSADRIAALMTGMIIVTAIFWARDPVTWGVLTVIAVPFLIIFRTKESLIEKFFMQFTGLYVLSSAIKSPMYMLLLGGSERSDGKALQKMLLLPEAFWAAVWLGLGLFTVFCLLRRHIRHITQRGRR